MATIANTDELIDAITSLETSVALPEGTVSSKMDATEINTLMQGIEDAFEKLYEKLRVLEDLHDFTKKYIENEFAKSKDAFRKAKADIDAAADTYQQTENVSHIVGFRMGSVVTDRDGTPVTSCAAVDGTTLIPSYRTIRSAEPGSAIIDANGTAYRRIITPAKNYKSFYVNETPPAEPVRETVQFVFQHPLTMNYMDFSAFQADVEDIRLKLSDGSEVEVPRGTRMCPLVSVAAVSLKLRSTKNEVQDVEVSQQAKNTSSLAVDYTSEIKDTIYESMIRKNGGTTYIS